MRLLSAIVALFIILPFVELYLLLKLAAWQSPELAIGIVIATGIVGGALARSQGLSMMNRLRRDLNSGRLPAAALIDGAMVLVGGALLITPGMITDFVGFVLLIPFTRAVLKKLLRRRIAKRLHIAYETTGTGRSRNVMDAEFTVHDNDEHRR
jgi:UPF0716 protein FxsA